MHAYLMELLKGLEAAVPPPPNCHHAMMFAQHGRDETGWQDKIALQINRDGTFHGFFLGPEDFDKPPAEVIAEIVRLMQKLDGAQLGVSQGKFID